MQSLLQDDNNKSNSKNNIVVNVNTCLQIRALYPIEENSVLN